MYKIWEIKDSKSNRIIAIHDQCIYKGNPKKDHDYLNDKQTDQLKELFGIPFSYLRKIENQSGTDKIILHYGNDSVEDLNIKDQTLKQEVFEYLKSHIPNFHYTKRLPSVFQYTKGQILACLTVLFLFIRTAYLAHQIESGVVYEIVGSKKSIASILLVIAHLGTIKVYIIFLILLSLIIFNLIRKLKSRSEIEILDRRA